MASGKRSGVKFAMKKTDNTVANLSPALDMVTSTGFDIRQMMKPKTPKSVMNADLGVKMKVVT